MPLLDWLKFTAHYQFLYLFIFYQLNFFLLIIYLCGYVHIHPSAPESRRGPQIAWRCEMPNMDAGNWIQVSAGQEHSPAETCLPASSSTLKISIK